MKAILFTSILATVDALSVKTSDLKGNSIKDFNFVDRVYVPYGPKKDSDPTIQPWDGLGFGTGATEHFAYDWKEGYVYSQSEVGAYITVLDWCTSPKSVSKYSLDLTSDGTASEIKDVVVCPEAGLLFMSLTDDNIVKMYETVKRNSPAPPQFLKDIDAGTTPDAMRVNDECTVLAVANQNEGRDLLTAGAMNLVTDFRGAGGPIVREVKISGFSDAELLANDVHMPLTQQAMKYWNTHSDIKDELNWDDIIDDDVYDPALFLDPEFIVFNHDSTEAYLNLQDNSAIARIDLETATVTRIAGMGLKSFKDNGIDLVKDDGCDLYISDPILYVNPTPDGIATVRVDDVDYILTADEGSDLDFDDYEEKYDSKDVFLDASKITLSGFQFKPSDELTTIIPHLAKDCDEDVLGWCSDMEITVGSSGVDYYTNEEEPILEKIVGIGGRGMSVLRVPLAADEKIENIWNSGDTFEKKGCEAFPWAHSAVQDEEYALVDGPAWTIYEDRREDIEEKNDVNRDGCAAEPNAIPPLKGLPGACPMSRTIDAKAPEDGLAVESVVVGVACSTLVAVACGENNSNCYLYDISTIESPKLLKVFNLSPASETQNPAYAYDQGTLGDLDAETTLFVKAEQSPTGKDGIIFGGAISGTLSFWEFECTIPVEAVRENVCFAEDESLSLEKDGDGLSTGAIVGIAVGCAVGGLLIGVVIYYKKMGVI